MNEHLVAGEARERQNEGLKDKRGGGGGRAMIRSWRLYMKMGGERNRVKSKGDFAIKARSLLIFTPTEDHESI